MPTRRDKKNIRDNSEKLIKCLEEVERRFSIFMRDMEKKGKSLSTMYEEMRSDPKGAVLKLRVGFSNVVEPVLLNEFDGTWMAFLLWDDYNGEFRILHNYSSIKPGYIDAKRYDFISQFVASNEFKESKLTEPMRDIIFKSLTQKKTLIFSWEKVSRISPYISRLQEDIRPIVIGFDELHSPGTRTALDNLDNFITQNQNVPEEQRPAIFKIFARRISEAADRILAAQQSNARQALKKAITTIYQEFKLTGGQGDEPLLEVGALCRSLIWNRLFDNNWKYLYYIPARSFEVGKAVSGIVCAFRDVLKPTEYVILMQIINRIFSLFNFGSYLQQIDQLDRQVNTFALRSATASIMARNKSHIHGSHIEHGLRNKMDDFENVVKARLLTDSPFYKTLRDTLTLSKDEFPIKTNGDKTTSRTS